MRRILLLSLFAACLFAAAPARADMDAGQPAPALLGPTLDGKTFDLSAIKGKVTVVYFWATYAAACRYELPTIEAIWRKYHSAGMELIAVAGDLPRAKAEVKQVMGYFSFPAAMLGALTKNEFGNPTTLPIAYVIDKQGVIQAVFTPQTMPLTESALGGTVKMLLDAKVEAPKPEPEKKPEEAKPPEPKAEEKK
jgi:cytochrome c biogenesis protein CcmG/thiol:disulfide interchange protein DsbE